VRLRRGAARPVAHFEKGDAGYFWSLEEDETRIAATPGEWRLGDDEATARTVVVPDGGEVVVDLE
jgi:hypothetical protein